MKARFAQPTFLPISALNESDSMAGKKEILERGGMGTGEITPGSGYDYELGGAPKKEKSSRANIACTIGKNVAVKRGGKKIEVSVKSGEKPFKLESGDRIETGECSYVIGLIDIPKGDDPSTSITLYPNSAIEITTKHSSAGDIEGGIDVITKVKFTEGMIMFGGPCEFEFKSDVPTKLSPMMAASAIAFCAELRMDGSIAFFNTVAEIEHTRAKVKAKLFAKETIATREALYCLPELEPRYAEAMKLIGLWAKSGAAGLDANALEALIPKAEDAPKQVKSAIEANIAQMRRELAENEYLPKSVVADYKRQIADFEQGKGAIKAAMPTASELKEAEKREKEMKEGIRKRISDGNAASSNLATLQLPAPQAPDKKYIVVEDKSEKRTMGFGDDYTRHVWGVSKKMNDLDAQFNLGKITKAELVAKKKALQEEMLAPVKKQIEHAANAGKEGAPMLDSMSAKAKIGKNIQYGAISIDVREVEMGPAFRGMKSPAGELFLAASLKLENTKSASTAYIVPDEEIWLGFGAGEPVKPENYKFETALDKGKPTEGYVFYKVPTDAKKFSLMFGKRKLPKTPVDFSL